MCKETSTSFADLTTLLLIVIEGGTRHDALITEEAAENGMKMTFAYYKGLHQETKKKIRAAWRNNR